jgi:PAS domain S-box-containing protein
VTHRQAFDLKTSIPALIVADRLTGELLSREVRAFDFEPQLVSKLDDAIEAFRSVCHPLVIATHGLGETDGIALCRGIRSQENRARALLLIATSPVAELRSILDAGADDYFILPCEETELRLRLRVAARRVHDRGESSRVEHELRLSNERFELAVRGTNDGLWDAFVPVQPWHKPDTIVWYSPRMKELVGFQDEEFPNLLESWESRLHPEDHDRIVHALVDHFEHRKPYDVEYRLRTKSGEYRWFSARGQAIWNERGEMVRMAGSVRDITQTKDYEARIKQSEAEWRSLVANAPDIIMLADLDGTIQFINRDSPAAQKSIGRSIYDYIAPEFQVIERNAMEQVRVTGVPQRFEVQGPSELTPGIAWYASRLGPIIRDGKVDSVVLIATDITDRKIAEQRVRREQDWLRRLLDLQERERQLVSYEIHDGLVQYLAAGLMHLETFAASNDPASKRSQAEYKTATTLLRNALAEARRLISGLRPPILDEQGVEAALEYLANEARQDIPDLKVMNRAYLGRLAAPLEVALFRITQEALTNARRHSGAKRAEVQLRRMGEYVRLTIRDWGCGFDPKAVHEERFGLQGIRQRARLLGTTATIESAPGKGTIVIVDFPIAADSGSAEKSPTETTEPSSARDR